VLLAHKNTVAHAQVLDQVRTLLDLEENLEVAPAVLFSGLLVLVRDHEIVDHALLTTDKSKTT